MSDVICSDSIRQASTCPSYEANRNEFESKSNANCSDSIWQASTCSSYEANYFEWNRQITSNYGDNWANTVYTKSSRKITKRHRWQGGCSVVQSDCIRHG
ncbi:unnamed protein product [Urochloa humidicola]